MMGKAFTLFKKPGRFIHGPTGWIGMGLLGLLTIFPSPKVQAPLPAQVELDYTFGQRMRFILKPESPFPIVQAILYYTLPNMELPQRVQVILGSQIPSQILYERDLRRDPLPPFVPLTFWWEVQDAYGNWWSTERQTTRYLDNRVAWRMISTGPLRLYWHAGDPGLARSVLELARQSLDRTGEPLGYRTTEPIELFWYADRELAQAAFRLTGLEIGGEVRPRWRAIILIASADAAGLETLRRLIPHELTHVILEEVAGGQPLPAWLEEGWALLNEGWPDPAMLRALQEPRLEGVSLTGLCGDFPSDPLRAPQAYALSWAVVRYIWDQEGIGGLRRLLEAYAEGVSCESGVRRILGRSLERLEQEAEAALQPRPLWRTVMESLGPWILLFLSISLGPILLIISSIFGQRSESQI
ncbi:MAG: peptidase MA family metallohydrolase [Anaerolineae bacterium]|nr:peptidase MA family metallohydrolase [Thermoflexus sp.]MDW8065181.1 peptidase MA family metallohydrolase [Anaerolineae bacterium]